MLKSLSVEMYLVVNCPMVKHTSGIEAHVDASVYQDEQVNVSIIFTRTADIFRKIALNA